MNPLRVLLLALCWVLVAATARAQSAPAEWPTRPVTLLVPLSAGGGTDAYARLLAQTSTERLKQTFVVENKPGASGAIGASAVAQAAPDGAANLEQLALLPVFDTRPNSHCR